MRPIFSSLCRAVQSTVDPRDTRWIGLGRVAANGAGWGTRAGGGAATTAHSRHQGG